MKNSQNGIDNCLQMAEERISELEHMEIIQSEKQKKKNKYGGETTSRASVNCGTATCGLNYEGSGGQTQKGEKMGKENT